MANILLYIKVYVDVEKPPEMVRSFSKKRPRMMLRSGPGRDVAWFAWFPDSVVTPRTSMILD